MSSETIIRLIPKKTPKTQTILSFLLALRKI